LETRDIERETLASKQAEEQTTTNHEFADSSVQGVSDEAKQLALAIASAGLDKKASGIEIIDVSGKVDYTELLVLMSGRGDRHVHAIASSVEQELKAKLGAIPLSVEGMTWASWVLLDFNDVVVHVFQEDARCFYDIEGLWTDAQRLPSPEPPDRYAADEAWS
jgi:ribosome-associated protein